MQRPLRKAHFIPLPFATGAVGLLFGVAMPRGISGGQGFLIGFLVGIAIIIIEVLAKSSGPQDAEQAVPQKPKSGYGR